MFDLRYCTWNMIVTLNIHIEYTHLSWLYNNLLFEMKKRINKCFSHPKWIYILNLFERVGSSAENDFFWSWGTKPFWKTIISFVTVIPHIYNKKPFLLKIIIFFTNVMLKMYSVWNISHPSAFHSQKTNFCWCTGGYISNQYAKTKIRRQVGQHWRSEKWCQLEQQ